MNLVSLIDYLRDRLRLVIGVGLGLLALLLVIDVVRVFSSEQHHAAPAAEHSATTGEHASQANKHLASGSATEHPTAGVHAEVAHTPTGFWASLYHIAETWPTFWAFFGFIACVLIVYVSKWYGHLKVGNTEIMTREDYYNE